jgi:[acyl-carrier-protein] S-malonyltransferase
MGRDFYENSSDSRPVFDEAAEIAGPEFLDVLFNGTKEQLQDTKAAQPALLTVEVAVALDLLDRGFRPDACAGHSLGEYSALVICRCLSFADAFRLVRERGRLMAERAPEGAMAAVIGLDAQAIEANLPDGAVVANYNGPSQTIISGTKEAVARAGEALKAAGARRVLPLNVSGPFHSPLMTEAAARFKDELAHIEFAEPSYPFISSVTGRRVDEPGEIRRIMERQILSPVRWTDVMTACAGQQAYEVGPGNVLQGLAKRMAGGPAVLPAGTIEQVNALEGSA